MKGPDRFDALVILGDAWRHEIGGSSNGGEVKHVEGMENIRIDVSCIAEKVNAPKIYPSSITNADLC